MTTPPGAPIDYTELARHIRRWGMALGFQQVGITDTDLALAESRLQQWLDKGWHGEMAYMARHGHRRGRPEQLQPGTLRVISVRMDYLPEPMGIMASHLDNPAAAFVSRYALGRDYHKLMRKRLQRLAERIRRSIGEFAFRVFVDSAPVLEKPLAAKAGLGWIGKHTNLINQRAGSWFFLGEIYTDLPLPADSPAADHCGDCSACIEICPTGAIVGPYQLDARLCVSYLTIELRGPIPESLRPLIGNRIYGCDDCQLVCPWNRFARLTAEGDFAPRQGLSSATLLELFSWSEQAFRDRTAGSAIRRIGYAAWLRNIAVALGNAPSDTAVIIALKARRHYPDPLVREHVGWALKRQGNG